MILDKSTEGIKEMWASVEKSEKAEQMVNVILSYIGVEPDNRQYRGICYAYKLDPNDPKSREEWKRIKDDMENEALKLAIKREMDISAVEAKVDSVKLDALREEAAFELNNKKLEELNPIVEKGKL